MSIGPKKRILIVDDDQDQLMVRELLLQARGFTTLAAHDAESAIDLARTERPDCALLDLHLPTEAAGLALFHSLQALPSPPRVVILTGRDIRRLQSLSELKLADAILEKGSPSTALLRVLNQLCAKPA